MYSIRGNERVTKSFYIISLVLHAFWLVLTYDLLENRRIDDVIIKTCFNSLLYKTNRFQVAVCLFSNKSQRTSVPRVSLFCSYHILTSSVIYYWTDARQLGIYLLSIIQLKNNLPADFTLLTVERVLVNTHKMLTLWAEIFWQFYVTAFAGLTFFVYLN